MINAIVTSHFMISLLKFQLAFFLFIQINEYSFNRKIVYDSVYFENQQKNIVTTYLINDDNNNYNAYLWKVSDMENNLTFVDQNGIYYNGLADTGILSKPSYDFKKENLNIYSNPYKYKLHNYDFSELSDTILNNKIYKCFIFKRKRESKKNYGSEVYIIDTSYNIKPLLINSTVFEVWKLRKNLPNGLIIEKYYYNSENKITCIEKLKSSESIDLVFKMP